MNILAIETASDACSAALYMDGDIIERFEIAPRQHTALLLPMLESVLAEGECSLSQLDALAVGRGPGAFTGVRIAIAAAQGIAFAADLPVASISTLEAMAYQAYKEEDKRNMLVAVDARMGEVYWGAYRIEQQYPILVGEELVAPPQSLPFPDDAEWYGIGSGWSEYSSLLQQHFPDNVTQSEQTYLPRAAYIAQLAVNKDKSDLLLPENLLPTYLRDKVV